MLISTYPEPSRTPSLYALVCVFTLVFMACSVSPTGPGEAGEGEHNESGSEVRSGGEGGGEQRGSGSEPGEGGTRYALSQAAAETRSGVILIIRYDAEKKTFVGNMANTTDAIAPGARVEVHLSNGTEIGPTPKIDMRPGQVSPVTLDASGQTFTWWSVHVELGASGTESGEGSGEHGGSGSEGSGEHGGSGSESGGS